MLLTITLVPGDYAPQVYFFTSVVTAIGPGAPKKRRRLLAEAPHL